MTSLYFILYVFYSENTLAKAICWNIGNLLTGDL